MTVTFSYIVDMDDIDDLEGGLYGPSIVYPHSQNEEPAGHLARWQNTPIHPCSSFIYHYEPYGLVSLKTLSIFSAFWVTDLSIQILRSLGYFLDWNVCAVHHLSRGSLCQVYRFGYSSNSRSIPFLLILYMWHLENKPRRPWRGILVWSFFFLSNWWWLWCSYSDVDIIYIKKIRRLKLGLSPLCFIDPVLKDILVNLHAQRGLSIILDPKCIRTPRFDSSHQNNGDWIPRIIHATCTETNTRDGRNPFSGFNRVQLLVIIAIVFCRHLTVQEVLYA